MRQVLELVVGAVGGFALLCAGVAILVWGVGKLQQARDSRDWPQAEGIVTESAFREERRDNNPVVLYTYTVEGKTYTSRQISFDVFDKPGGKGRVESILARYPVGQKVTVYRHPNDPATAILEPEDYAPFLQPLLFGVLFLFGGVMTLVLVIRQLLYGRPSPRQGIPRWRLLLAAATSSVVIYAILVVVSFGSAVREIHVLAFGERPLGLPNIVFMLALQTLLYLPMPWVFWHAVRLTLQSREDGEGVTLGLGYLLTVHHGHPHLRYSQKVCLGGLLYFVAICGAWIVYAAILDI